MKRTQWIAFGALFAFAALVLVFALRNRQAPQMPPDEDHGWRNAETCLECHAPGKQHLENPNHPVGRDCLQCHAKAR